MARKQRTRRSAAEILDEIGERALSAVRAKGSAAAIAIADLHLWHKAPIARAEKNWFKLQAFYLSQLYRVSVACDGAPVIIGGDVFEYWSTTNELVNWSIRHMPRAYGVPGNHDLPHHRYSDIGKTALDAMIAANRFYVIPPEEPIELEHMILYGFPPGYPPARIKRPPGNRLHIAVVHDYIWNGDNEPFPGVPAEAHVDHYERQLRGFDIAVFGDNHKPFIHRGAKTTIINSGTFIRRHADEINYKPSVWIIHVAGNVSRIHLNTKRDKFNEDHGESMVRKAIDLTAFNQMLEKSARDKPPNFGKHLMQWCKSHADDPKLKEVVLEAYYGPEKVRTVKT